MPYGTRGRRRQPQQGPGPVPQIGENRPERRPLPPPEAAEEVGAKVLDRDARYCVLLWAINSLSSENMPAQIELRPHFVQVRAKRGHVAPTAVVEYAYAASDRHLAGHAASDFQIAAQQFQPENRIFARRTEPGRKSRSADFASAYDDCRCSNRRPYHDGAEQGTCVGPENGLSAPAIGSAIRPISRIAQSGIAHLPPFYSPRNRNRPRPRMR